MQKRDAFQIAFPSADFFLQLYFVLPFSFPDEALKICQTQLVSLWSSVLRGRLKKIAEKPLVVYGPAHKVHIISEIHRVKFKGSRSMNKKLSLGNFKSLMKKAEREDRIELQKSLHLRKQFEKYRDLSCV